MPSLHLIPRADDDDIVCNYWGCVSYTSYVIKWAVFGGLMAACLLFFFGGYIHAKQRMKKGLAPLSYHRVRSCLPIFLSGPPLLTCSA